MVNGASCLKGFYERETGERDSGESWKEKSAIQGKIIAIYTSNYLL